MPLYLTGGSGGGAVTNAGTFAVQEDGAALTALQLIDNAVSGAGFNITQFGGAAVPIGAGLEATAIRVTFPTDGTGVVTLTGDLPDTSAGDLAAMVVDLAAIEVLLGTIDTDTGAIATASAAIQTAVEGTLTVSGTVTANLSATDNAVLDTIDAAIDAVDATTQVRYVTVSMSTPSDAQDAGDVIAATQAVAACCPANDQPGLLQSLVLIDTDDQKVNIKAVFFSANTALGTEDAAPDIDDTEALTVIGIVDIAAADYVDLGGAAVATIKNIGLPITPASGTDDIYVALYSPTGGTWASQVITLRLGFM